MSKFFVRLTIIIIALYMVVCHITMMVWQINLWYHTYTVLFEICLCMCMTAHGSYHCKYLKWTAYAICLNDTIISTDEMFNLLPYSWASLLPIFIITTGLSTTVIMSIQHYKKVKRLKRVWVQERKKYLQLSNTPNKY